MHMQDQTIFLTSLWIGGQDIKECIEAHELTLN